MRTIVIAVGTLALGLAAAQAATYPLSGKWGYDRSSGAGPIDCDNRPIIAFAGDRRFETGGTAPPDYRNVSVQQINATTFRIVDRFFNGMQLGKVIYTLRIVDRDRIEIRHAMGGATFRLRRCN